MAAKNITIIPATKMMHTGLPCNAAVKKRVAGYARVSTDSEEQQTSYEAQVDYYTKYIQSKPEWTFVKVYTDVDTPYGRNTKARHQSIFSADLGRFFVGPLIPNADFKQ